VARLGQRGSLEGAFASCVVTWTNADRGPVICWYCSWWPNVETALKEKN